MGCWIFCIVLGEQCHQIVLKHLESASLPEVDKVFGDLKAWESMTEPERMARCNQHPEERAAATRNWFQSFHEVSSQNGLSKFAAQCLQKSNACTRGNLNSTFHWIQKWNVPLFVISAGIRELLTQILNMSMVELPSHACLLANSLDDPGVQVTSRNKAEGLSRIPEFPSLAAGKTHVLLLGDKPSDCAPLQGLPKDFSAFRVAFLNEPQEETLAEYSEHFDVLLVGDPSMDFVNALLDMLSAPAVGTRSPRL